MDPAAAYTDTRERLTALLEGLSPDLLDTAVPACPEWSVRDLLSHLAGVPADLVSGNLAGAGSEEWTAAQVAARRQERSLGEVLAEWADAGGQVAATVLPNVPPPVQAQIVGDAITHDNDIRAALGLAGKDAEQVDVALQTVIGFLDDRLKAKDLPAVRLRAPSQEWIVGAGEPAATLTAEPLELLRVVTGRRSLDQVHALAWEGDPEPVLAGLNQYPWSATPVVD